jgi:hypothetical protein
MLHKKIRIGKATESYCRDRPYHYGSYHGSRYDVLEMLAVSVLFLTILEKRSLKISIIVL